MIDAEIVARLKPSRYGETKIALIHLLTFVNAIQIADLRLQRW